MFFSLSFDIDLCDHFFDPFEQVISDIFKVVIYSFTDDVKCHDSGICIFDGLSERFCTLIYEIFNKGYIMINSLLLLNNHFLLQFRLYFFFIFRRQLIFLLSFILQFTGLANHFKQSFLVYLTSVEHVIYLHHLIFGFLLGLLSSVVQ